MQFLKQKKNKGFTLVELMVAVAVFSIVMVTAASALLNVIEANRKAQAIKTAINNINFALEAISKDMRVGTEYMCSDNGGNFEANCPDGGDKIKYRSVQAYKNLSGYGEAFYYFDEDLGAIMSCVEEVEGENGNCDIYDEDIYSRLTSEEIVITSARFYVVGNGLDSDGNRQQPRMVMTLKGVVNEGKKTETEFDLQTSVSQRARILQTN